jgi:diguanylate cyclase (GGDEF)-like protein/PAS domain S-box-containing protein
MHETIIPLVEKHVNSELHLSAMNKRLNLALESSRQIVFDWHILDDRLYFSDELAGSLKGVLLDTSTPWSSSALPAIIHEDDKENLRQHLHTVLKRSPDGDGAFYNIELRLKHTVCSWRWVDISGKVVERDCNGQAIRMVGIFSDINERKLAENKIARLRELYIALSQTNQAIVRINNRDALFTEICRIAVEHGRFHMAWIGLMDHAGKQVVSAAAHGNGPDALRDTVISIHASSPEGGSVIETAMRENTPHICNDLLDAPSFRHCREDVAQSGFRSLASFPFKLSGKPFGALNLYAVEKDFFDTPLIDLLKEMANNISFAIDRYEREAQRKAIEAAVIDSEKIKSAILTAALDCIISINHNGEIISFNQAAARTFGYQSEDALGKKLGDLIVPPEWREQHNAGIERFLATGKSTMLNKRIELTAMRVDGSTFPIELAIVPLSVQNHPIFTAFIRDISERKQAETLQLEQNRILNMVATGVALPEILTEITRFVESRSDRSLCSIMQINIDGTALTNRIAPSLPLSYLSQLGESRVGPCSCSCGTAAFLGEPVMVTDIATDPLWNPCRDLALEHGLRACTSWPILGKNRKVLGTFALYFREAIAPTVQDIQLFDICTKLAGIAIESRASEEKIRYLAHYDGLTSLPNRFLFREYLDLALRNAQRHGEKFAVLFLDLDKFKEINDTLGHDAGDKVLREISKRLRSALRHTDKIARMGGDEFYVLIEELSDGHYAADIAQKLLDGASRPIRIGDQECQLSVSIGISIYPGDGNDGPTLLKNADGAMYRAKERGKNTYQFYSPHEEGHHDGKMGLFRRHLPSLTSDTDCIRPT